MVVLVNVIKPQGLEPLQFPTKFRSPSTATFEAFNATTIIDSVDMVTNPAGTLAEALGDQPGIAKRSFGAGSGRPIIRGFDGDRVLILEDGIRTGDLSSQSGDHGVNTDPNGLDRIEAVRGPATLLYGSNSLGGVVNAITPNESFKDSLVVGTRGQVSVDGGSANKQAGNVRQCSAREGRPHGMGRWRHAPNRGLLYA